MSRSLPVSSVSGLWPRYWGQSGTSFLFNVHLPADMWCGVSFHMPFCHLCVFFGERSVQVFLPIFIWVVCSHIFEC